MGDTGIDMDSPVQAVVFDFDGVIADTEPLHHRAFCEVVREDGLACSWEDYVRNYIGFDDRDLFRAAYSGHVDGLSEQELSRKIDAKAASFLALTRDGVNGYDGIPDVVHTLAAVYPLGLCSGALRSDIDPILRHLDLTTAFRVRVTAEDVPASKPDPACYRLVVDRLSDHIGRRLDPAFCVAIEDTPAGIQSAKAAGLRVWAVTHTHDLQAVAQADGVVDSLHDILHQLGIKRS